MSRWVDSDLTAYQIQANLLGFAQDRQNSCWHDAKSPIIQNKFNSEVAPLYDCLESV